MVSLQVNSNEWRFLLPEVILLETEDLNQAREISNQVRSEAHQWQNYLNALALLGFEQWLSEYIPQPINRDKSVIETACNFKVGKFKVCLFATEHLLDEVINVPQDFIDKPELAAHFYIVLEVLEEQRQVIIRGFLRYDQLINYRSRVNLQLGDGYYHIPLSEFDAEPNHLLFYYRFLEPAAIPLPVASSETKASEKLLGYLKETRTKLSQWLQGVFDEGWQAIDALINQEANLTLSTRNAQEGAKRAKLIDLGMQLGSQTVALLASVIQEAEEKLSILLQLHPTSGERYLPPHLKLTLLSKAGKTLQEVQSRSQDNYIQLKPFKGETGKRFSIEVSLGDLSVREDFEL